MASNIKARYLQKIQDTTSGIRDIGRPSNYKFLIVEIISF